MIKKYKKIISLVFLFLILFSGAVFAEDNSSIGNEEEPEVFEIKNPIKYESISELIKVITNTLIKIGIALIAAMVTLGSFFIMIGGANPKYVTKGKNIITWTLIGLAVVLFARALLEIISTFVSS